MIVCSCNHRSDVELKEEARKGTLWRDAVKNLPVTNKCGRCKDLTKPMFAAARREAGFPDEPEKRHRPKSDDTNAHDIDEPGSEDKQ